MTNFYTLSLVDANGTTLYISLDSVRMKRSIHTLEDDTMVRGWSLVRREIDASRLNTNTVALVCQWYLDRFVEVNPGLGITINKAFHHPMDLGGNRPVDLGLVFDYYQEDRKSNIYVVEAGPGDLHLISEFVGDEYDLNECVKDYPNTIYTMIPDDLLSRKNHSI